jgi:2-dehydropantoate 2-reductase
MQQHLIFGAGLIGGYLGGVMASQSMSVAMVARASVQEKYADGMQLSDYQGNKTVVDAPVFIMSDDAITATSNNGLNNSDSKVSCRFLWLTVKCTAVSAALSDVAPWIDNQTIIFCCQNGLGSEVSIKKRFPHNRVLRVMVPFNVAEIKPGHLHRGSEGDLTVECDTEDIKPLLNQINTPLMPVRASIDIQAVLAAKLQLNLANAVNALADVPVKSMLEQRDYRRCIALLMKEWLAVIDKKEWVLPKLTAVSAKRIPQFILLPDFLFRLFAQKMLAVDPTVRTSMWWDLSQGKPSEVEYLNGAVVSQGKILTVDCPANERIVELVRDVESGRRQQGIGASVLLAELSG